MNEWLFLVVFFIFAPLPASGEDPFAPIGYLIGTWEGNGEGLGGSSKVVHDFDLVFSGKFIRWSTRAEFSPKEEGGRPETHQDIGFFSYDPERKKILLRQFLSEGYVNTYVLKEVGKDGHLVLESEHSEGAGGMRARLSITILEPGKYRGRLELAPPGKEFFSCRTQEMHRLGPANWVKGLDVSHFSGEVDWAQIKSEGHQFAFVKATEGHDWVDPTFAGNMAKLKHVGITRGAYHFFVGHDDPEPQAQNFIENVKLAPGDLPPVVDIETLSNRPVDDLAARLKTWLTLVEQHYGVKPIIYTSRNFWNAQIKEPFEDYPLWVAEYGTDLPRIPNGWLVWAFWQFEDGAKPPGISKMADLNYFNGSHDELKKLLIGEPAPADP